MVPAGSNGVRPGRTEADGVLRAGLPVILGGETLFLRPLTWERSEIWIGHVKKQLGEGIASVFADPSLKTIDAAVMGSTGKLVDLLIEYDELGALPAADWFPSHATKREIYDAFVGVLEYEEPPLDLIRKLLPEQIRTPLLATLISAAAPLSGASSSGPSPRGAIAAPVKSRRR